MRRFIGLVALAIATAGCGGGGSGDTDGGGTSGSTAPAEVNNSWLTFDPAQISITTTPGQASSISITARSSKKIAETLNVAIVDSAGVFNASKVNIRAFDQLTYVATLETMATLAAKTHTGSLIVKLCLDDPRVCNSPYPGSPWQIPFSVTVPAVISGPDAIDLGSITGHDLSAKALTLSLNTDSGEYPWSVKGVPDWMTISSTSGTISKAPLTLSLTPSGYSAEKKSAQLIFSVAVNGTNITKSVNIVSNIGVKKLLASEVGVAFTSIPGWSILSRTIKISDNFGLPTNWAAKSNQPWLRVSQSGYSLTLTADPATLPINAMSYAKVALTNPDDSKEEGEEITIGVWKGSSAPAATMSIPLDKGAKPAAIVADTIRPYIYVVNHNNIDDGSNVDVYNVYTARKIKTIPLKISTYPISMYSNYVETLDSLIMSHDGKSLYIKSTTPRAGYVASTGIQAIDLETDTLSNLFGYSETYAIPGIIRYIRPNGVGMLLSSARNTYDTVNKRVIYVHHLDDEHLDSVGGDFISTPDGRTVIQSKIFGSGSAGIYPFAVDYQPDHSEHLYLKSNPLVYITMATTMPVGTGMAVSPDSETLFTTPTYRSGCSAWDLKTGKLLRKGADSAEMPSMVLADTQGRVYCGSPLNMAISNRDGSPRPGIVLANYTSASGFAVTSDGLMAVIQANDSSATGSWLIVRAVGP